MKTVFAAATLASALAAVNAFEISFPNNGDQGYWVTNYTNTLNWKANSSDPSYFSVQLLNQNSSELNGNFQVGNALTTANGTAPIFLDMIPVGTYTLLFVNSSNYELDRPEVYYTSGTFEVKPNGTEPAKVEANTSSNPSDSQGSSSNGSGSGSGSQTSTGAQPSGTAVSQGSNSAGGLKAGSAAALATVALGLGLSLVL